MWDTIGKLKDANKWARHAQGIADLLVPVSGWFGVNLWVLVVDLASPVEV